MSRKKVCPNCGSKLDIGAGFCRTCGAVQPPVYYQRSSKVPTVIAVVAAIAAISVAGVIAYNFVYAPNTQIGTSKHSSSHSIDDDDEDDETDSRLNREEGLTTTPVATAEPVQETAPPETAATVKDPRTGDIQYPSFLVLGDAVIDAKNIRTGRSLDVESVFSVYLEHQDYVEIYIHAYYGEEGQSFYIMGEMSKEDFAAGATFTTDMLLSESRYLEFVYDADNNNEGYDFFSYDNNANMENSFMSIRERDYRSATAFISFDTQMYGEPYRIDCFTDMIDYSYYG